MQRAHKSNEVEQQHMPTRCVDARGNHTVLRGVHRSIITVARSLGRVVFPRYCIGCERGLPVGTTWWCDACHEKLVGNEQHGCLRCSARLDRPSPLSPGCALCYNVRTYFDRAVSLGNYRGDLQSTIREVKAKSSDVIAWQLGVQLAERLLPLCEELQPVGVIPVPDFWKKRLWKGFSAALQIAGGVAATLGLPLFDKAVVSTKATQKQGLLSTSARVKNVKGAFRMHRRFEQRFAGRSIVLVDDVMTSCATANEVTKVLQRGGGATDVSVAVVARGVRAT